MRLDCKVNIKNNKIEITLESGVKKIFDIVQFPDLFLEWQSVSRKRLFDLIREKGTKSIRMQPAHLPVVATLGEGDFPINLANKGLGMLPKESMLEKYVSIFNNVIEETKDIDRKIIDSNTEQLDFFEKLF